MKILCFGSINLDYIYKVDHFVNEHETLPCQDLSIQPGGKGLNQSIALSNAGADTYFAGCIGPDSQLLTETLEYYNINYDYIKQVDDTPTGHAMIQNNPQGDNCILVYKGSNKCLDVKMINETLNHFQKGDMLVIQNEINLAEYIIRTAKKRGMTVALNPSPFSENLRELKTNEIDYLILNEIEAFQMLDLYSEVAIPDIDDISQQKYLAAQLSKKYPKTNIVLTLGKYGSIFANKNTMIKQNAFTTNIVDTTGAGDTYLGYFIAEISLGTSIEQAMEKASKAASITISQKGAALSIPKL